MGDNKENASLSFYFSPSFVQFVCACVIVACPLRFLSLEVSDIIRYVRVSRHWTLLALAGAEKEATVSLTHCVASAALAEVQAKAPRASSIVASILLLLL